MLEPTCSRNICATWALAPTFGVGICLPRSIEMVVTVLGILKAGGAYVPLDPDYPTDRLAFIVADSGVSLVVSQPQVEQVLPVGDVRRVWIAETGTRIALTDPAGGSRPVNAGSLPRREGGPDSLAYVIYTSGSTGRPKGVEIEHRSAVNFLLGMQALLPFKPEHTLVAVTPLSFDISALELLLPLISGARVVMASGTRHPIRRRLRRCSIASAQLTCRRRHRPGECWWKPTGPVAQG